jgi:hypothetical protein
MEKEIGLENEGRGRGGALVLAGFINSVEDQMCRLFWLQHETKGVVNSVRGKKEKPTEKKDATNGTKCDIEEKGKNYMYT